MYPEEQGIARPTKPGPIARAVSAVGIAAPVQTEPRSVELDPFAYRGSYPADAPKGPRNGPDSTALDPAPHGIASGLPQPAEKVAAAPIQQQGGILAGISTGIGNEGAAPPVTRQVVGDHAPSPNAQAGIAAMTVGRNEQGIITAESAAGAMGADMTRSGGIAGTYDGKGVNEILARENKARGEMIDSMIKAQGGNGAAILEPSQGPVIERSPLAEMPRGLSPRQQASFLNEQSRISASMRGNDPQNVAGRQRAGNPAADALTAERTTGQQLRNEQAQRLNDLQQQLVSEVDPNRRQEIAGQIKALNGRTEPQARAGNLTLPQRRSNFEIDAARERIAGMSPEEIKRKTANYTATGRENPDFDPTLAKAVSLANRRKYGDDVDFDQRQQVQQPAGDDGDVATRFKSDRAMQGYTLGKQTDSGVEVFDASGKLVGHYR